MARQPLRNMDKNYYIICCENAGIFFAQIAERRGSEADLVDARRLHYWDGSASVNQIAVEGLVPSSSSRVTIPVERMTVLGVVSLTPMTPTATENILARPPWKR